MFFIMRLFRYLTLVSLLFWGGLFIYIMIKQPAEVAAPGWPRDYNECVQQWGQPGNMAAVQLRCGDYYAALGDRTSPFLSRAKAQIVGRLSDKIIQAYLSEVRLVPGQVVGGADIIKTLGTARVTGMLVDVVRESGEPASATRKKQLACLLDKTRQSPARLSESTLQQQCAAYR